MWVEEDPFLLGCEDIIASSKDVTPRESMNSDELNEWKPSSSTCGGVISYRRQLEDNQAEHVVDAGVGTLDATQNPTTIIKSESPHATARSDFRNLLSQVFTTVTHLTFLL